MPKIAQLFLGGLDADAAVRAALDRMSLSSLA